MFEADGAFVLVTVRATDRDHRFARAGGADHAHWDPHPSPGAVERERDLVQALARGVPIDARDRRCLKDHPGHSFMDAQNRHREGRRQHRLRPRCFDTRDYLSSQTSVKKSRCCGWMVNPLTYLY